jgi:hypothetical protein
VSVSSGVALDPEAIAPPRFDDVLGAASELRLGHLRLSIPWASVEARQGAIDGTIVEQLRDAATRCRAAGIEPWFALLQPEVPTWFGDDRGWIDGRSAARDFAHWVERASGLVGDLAAGWIPIEAPYALAGRVAGGDERRTGEVLETLVLAWRDAWRILRGGGPLVATSLDFRQVRPRDATPEAAGAARREELARWDTWLDGLADGNLAVPGRGERPLADLQGACDVLGVALSGDVERILQRTADSSPIRPLAVTFRVTGESTHDRRARIEGLRADLQRCAEELDVRWATVVAQLPDEAAILAP